MSRKYLLLAPALLIGVIGASEGMVNAEPDAMSPFAVSLQVDDLIKPPQEKPKLKNKVHEVVAGDTLRSIAKKYHTTWQKLYYKNIKVKDPNVIEVGSKLTIPKPSEKLKKRDIVDTTATLLTPATGPQNSSGGYLIAGVLGYALPYGNCVNEPGVNNPGWGNPIDWPVLSMRPTIGATALWTFNHTGVVVGLWSNGDVEVRHQNYYGDTHRFPLSAFRGFR